MSKLISIIIPVYNEELNINECYSALNEFSVDHKANYDFEFVFTDNHSTDNTFDILNLLHNQDKRVRVFRFSKNFGYQRSILEGYKQARGDAVVQFDCDLQDPISLVCDFIQEWESGSLVVYGIRTSRREGFFITSLRKIFYRFLNYISDENLPLDAGDFRLIDRRVVDILCATNDAQPYLRGLISTIGFRQVGIEYSRNDRVRGSSKFNFGRLMSLAVDAIISHSVVPLRIASALGISVAVFTVIGILIYGGLKFFFNLNWPSGFTTLAVLVLFGISLNALLLGIIGEYIGRIYSQQKNFPNTIIECKLECDD